MSTTARIRHVAICTSRPWAVEAEVVNTLQLAVVQRDKFNEGIRIRNGVFALQDTFLEITTPATPDAATQRFLEKRGEGGYMVCVQVDDLEIARVRAAALGVRVALFIDGYRSGDQTISALHLHPADTGGALFSVERADPSDSWAWGGEAWRDYGREDVVRDIVGVEISSPNPARLARKLAALFDAELDGSRVVLNSSTIAITQAPPQQRGDRFDAINILATDRARKGEAHAIGGALFRFV